VKSSSVILLSAMGGIRLASIPYGYTLIRVSAISGTLFIPIFHAVAFAKIVIRPLAGAYRHGAIVGAKDET